MFANNTQNKLTQLGWLLHGAGLLLTLVSIVGAWMLLFWPIAVESADLNRQVDSLAQLVVDGDKIISENRELRQILDDVENRIQHLASQIPQTARESDFLAQLSELARETELEIKDYHPGVAKTEKNHSELQIALSIEGKYTSVCRFLADLREIPRLCRIINLQIHTQSNQSSGEDVLDISMTLKIYYSPTPKSKTPQVKV